VKPGRGTLAQRISLLAIAVAMITALTAGAVSASLIRKAGEASARRTLSQLADASQATADLGANAEAGQLRARRTLMAIHIQSATVDRSGQLTTNSRLVRDGLTASEVTALLSGSPVSARRVADGDRILIEARPTRVGAIVLVQRRSDAIAGAEQAIRRIVFALLVAAGIAVLLGLFVARRLARPLRRTAEAAHALASGRRDVEVVADGPAEVAEVAEAINVLAAALSHSEARQREFLLSVSHELRTPLTTITGYAESLADGVIDAADAPQTGSIILNESHRLNRLVADLLDLARLGAQEFRLELSDVDLTDLAQSATVVWTSRCANVGVRFVSEVTSAPVLAHTDAARVRQVLDGLLENALRLTPADAPIVLAIRCETSADGRQVAVAEVRDGGPGLTASDVSVAFERSVLYERYRGIRQVGTGLGLAIVDGLISRLGGTVEAGHAAEGGARFTVRLPTPRQ
jgi:two-component system sensor histidine kinase BaeS